MLLKKQQSYLLTYLTNSSISLNCFYFDREEINRSRLICAMKHEINRYRRFLTAKCKYPIAEMKFKVVIRVFHKLDEIGNNANIGIRCFTDKNKKFSDKMLPTVRIEPGSLINF